MIIPRAQRLRIPCEYGVENRRSRKYISVETHGKFRKSESRDRSMDLGTEKVKLIAITRVCYALSSHVDLTWFGVLCAMR